MQSFKIAANAAGEDLHADAEDDERREPHEHVGARLAQQGGGRARPAIADIYDEASDKCTDDRRRQNIGRDKGRDM